MNKVMLSGRIARDVTLETTIKGQKVVRNAVASKRLFKDVNGRYLVDFIEFTLFDTKAEHFSEYVSKGDVVELIGRLIVKEREKEGIKFKTNELIVETVEFLSGKSGGSDSE